MAIKKDTSALYFKWYSIVIYAVTGIIVLLALFTNIFRSGRAGTMPLLFWILGAVLLFFTLVVILATLTKIIELLEYNARTLDRISEAQEKQRTALSQILSSVRLSDSAKLIAYRGNDARAIREAVFNRLQNDDFEGAHSLIDELEASAPHQELAEKLRIEADKYQSATVDEREAQLIVNIEQLLNEHEWSTASLHIENLIKAYPESEKAKQMRQKLIDKKLERKKVLLNMWDDAVNRQATDRSLEILRELDPYLTPNEGLALQEAARDIFRSKLHSLGVRFSIAVSGKQWAKALETGEDIVRDFPNSRMAQEIVDRMDVLRQRVNQTAQ